MDPKEVSGIALLALRISNGMDPVEARKLYSIVDPWWTKVADAVAGQQTDDTNANLMAKRYKEWYP